MKRFKYGAFKMAIHAQVPIIPMVTKPLKYVLDVPNRIAKGGEQEIKILPPISTKGMSMSDLESLVARCEDIYRFEISQYLGSEPSEIFGPASERR